MTPQIGIDRFRNEETERLELWVGTAESGGRVVGAWESFRVRRSITSASGSFEFTAPASELEGIEVGQELDVVVHGAGVEQAVLVGNVENRDDELGGSVKIRGRDRAGDVVDCSAPVRTWVDEPLSRIVQDLTARHAVRVDMLAPDVVIAGAFSTVPPEKSWNTIERLIRNRGLLAYSGTEGNLVIATAGAGGDAVGELAQGVNLQPGSKSSRSDGARHRTYVVRGQTPGSDSISGGLVAHSTGTATDGDILRDRTLEIVAETAVDNATAQLQAEWEAAIRAARANRWDLVVAGFRQPVGQTAPSGSPAWSPNQLVAVHAPTLRVENRRLLIESVTFERSPTTGSKTSLVCVPANSYTPQPTVEVQS